MKPVAIFRASPTEGPGYFATYLERHSIAWQLVALDADARVPRDARAYAGLVFMGGPMSVNDDLPWIAPTVDLIRDAVRMTCRSSVIAWAASCSPGRSAGACARIR